MGNDENISAIAARLLERLAIAGVHGTLVPSVPDVFDQSIETFGDFLRRPGGAGVSSRVSLSLSSVTLRGGLSKAS
jgi:hypothetical protein